VKKNRLPWIVSVVLVVVLATGGVWYYKAKNAKGATNNFIFGNVTRGSVSKKINATGTVQIPTQYNLSFNGKSKITQVNVAVGDSVKAGQVLAKLDETVANQQIQQAKTSLANAQASLTRLKNVDVISVQRSLKSAQINLINAQQTLNLVKNAPDLTKAQSYDKALSNYTSLDDAIQAEQRAVDLAQLDVNYNQAVLDSKTSGTDLKSAQAAVDQANSNLTIAQAASSDYVLLAPADGTVATVNGKVGEYPGTSASGGGSSSVQSAFIVLEASSPNVQINVPADEADIGSVQVNQAVDITLPAYPDKKFSGTVTQVSQIGQTQSNVTTFPVTVTAANPDGLMKAGMSANVSIIIAQKQNVLIVPSEAVRGSGNNKTVMLPPAAGATQPGRQDVQIGLDDGKNAEVLSGLQEGDQVVVGFKASTTTQKSTTSGNPFGGMGGSAVRGTGGGATFRSGGQQGD